MIAEALNKKDAEESLRKTFEQIKLLGQKTQYKQGFRQFEQFMEAVSDRAKKEKNVNWENHIVRELMIELATDTFMGSDTEKQQVQNIIQAQPQWQSEYDNLVAEIEQLHERPEGIGISLFRENELLESFTFTKFPDSKTIDNISPASYNMAFATGRIIWQGRLNEQDLIWTEAFPGQALRLSADTGEPEGKSTQEYRILGGEVILRVYAGLESGRIEITMNLS
jgi:hypothetical protein